VKNVLNWVKSHLALVICAAVVLVSLPVAWFFSSGWNTKIKSKQESAAGDKLKQIEGAKVTYSLPRLSPTEPAIEVSAPPNQTLTDWFKVNREKIIAQAQGIVQEAERINRREHAPLIDGLFPNATGQAAQEKALELAEKIVYTGRDTSAYPQLLRSIRAGEPLKSEALSISLSDEKTRLEEQITSGVKRTLTNDELDKVQKDLLEKRMDAYRSHASEISVYASMDIFPSGANTGSYVPQVMPDKPPTLEDCFFWQFDYWLMSDVLAAIGKANTGPDGQATSVDKSVVKRLERVIASDVWVASFSTGESTGEEGSTPATVDAGSPDALIEPKFDRSISGRWSGPGNAVFDIRNVQIVAVVSSSRLPELFNAFARTNFMTVTDIDLAEVDVWTELEQGYFYGSEHVVRATMTVETVWLRSWTVPMMPPTVRGYLGLATEEPKPEGATDGSGAEGSPPVDAPVDSRSPEQPR
jgi:hypothetical protein